MAKGDYTEVFKGEDGQYRWHRKAANHRIIASSGESFDSKGNAERAAERTFPEQEPETDDEEAHPAPILFWVAAIILSFILGVLLGMWLRDRDDSGTTPIPSPVTTTTATSDTTTSLPTPSSVVVVPGSGSAPTPTTSAGAATTSTTSLDEASAPETGSTSSLPKTG